MTRITSSANSTLSMTDLNESIKKISPGAMQYFNKKEIVFSIDLNGKSVNLVIDIPENQLSAQNQNVSLITGFSIHDGISFLKLDNFALQGSDLDALLRQGLVSQTINKIIDQGGSFQLAAANDLFVARQGQNNIIAGEGSDTIYGGAQNDTILGGNGNDFLVGNDGNDLIFGENGDDILYGHGGNDIFYMSSGKDWINGGEGTNTLVLNGRQSDFHISILGNSTFIKGNSGETISFGISNFVFNDATLDTNQMFRVAQKNEFNFSFNTENVQLSHKVSADVYVGPAFGIQTQFFGTEKNDMVIGTSLNDFIFADKSDDAVDGAAGNDVIDGGLGSNFLIGGSGKDVFFLDARNSGINWSTITDYEIGEEVVIWGFNPGSSKYFFMEDQGTAGFKGTTLHADIDNDGFIDSSVTFAGLSRDQLGAPLEMSGLLWLV